MKTIDFVELKSVLTGMKNSAGVTTADLSSQKEEFANWKVRQGIWKFN